MRVWVLVVCAFALVHSSLLDRRRVNSLLNNATKRAEICARTGFLCENKPNAAAIKSAYLRRHGSMPAPESLEPVILFPGLGGSGFEVEIDKGYKPAWDCFKHWSWWGIWINIYEALFQTCWFDNLYLGFNSTTGIFSSNKGVYIKPRDFGGLSGVDKLDHFDDPLDLTAYYQPIINSLKLFGYKAGVTLFGAPFDWRYSTDDLMKNDLLGTNNTYMVDIRLLVERAYRLAGNKKVHLITHSMGGPTALYFLNAQPLEWKQLYIASFVPIAGPWTGATKALKSMISGDNLGLFFPILDFSLLSLKDITKMMRVSGGTAMMQPDLQFYGNQVFVTLKNPPKNYTPADFGQLFLDLGAPITTKLIVEKQDIISNLVHPQVPSYCLYGYGKPTEIKLSYDSWPKNPADVAKPTVDYSDLGDGTVPLYSLIQCKDWVDKEHTSHPVNCKEYKLGHAEILKDGEVHLDLVEIVTGKTKIVGCSDSQTPKFLEAVEENKKYRN